MKIDVRDRQLLQSLAPIEVAAYLRSRGWHEQPGIALDSALFTLGTDYEVALPLSSALRDFALRMVDAIRTLEIAEDRDQTEILADLSVSASDVVRVRLNGTDARDGSLPLAMASDVISRSYDLVLAAACAAVDPKYYFSSRKPPAASDYMRNVRMGQTERGSFVVTILSRVTPDLLRPQAEGRPEVPEPFERKVTERLASAMAAIGSAAKAAIATGNIDTFEASVERGVSANLCEALAGLCESDGADRTVEVSLSWARVRPTKHGPQVHYQVDRDIVPLLREVARVFKSRAPQEDFELRGPVIRLVRVPPTASGGEVTIAGFVDGLPRNIWVHLEGHDYSRAAEAFKDRLLICATGVLKKDGQRYWLHTPRAVGLLSPEDD